MVDDGSTDNTALVMAEYLAKDSRFQFHHRPKERAAGGNAARNYGFEVSKGEYVQWFDSDDIMLPDFLKIKVLRTSENKVVILTTGIKKKTDGLISEIPLSTSGSLFKNYVMGKSQVLTPSAMFKSSFLENKLLFHESLQRSQESEFFSRMFYHLDAEQIAIENSITFEYLITADSKTTKDATYNSIYKRSHFMVHYNNLVRSIVLADQTMCKALYKKLSRLIEASIYNDKVADYNFYIFHLKRIVKPNRMRLLKLVYLSFKTVNKRSFQILKRLRRFSIELSWFKKIDDEEKFYIREL